MLIDFILDHIIEVKRPITAREIMFKFKAVDFAVEEALSTLHAWGRIKQYVTTSGTFFEYVENDKEETGKRKSGGGLTLDMKPISSDALKSFRERMKSAEVTKPVSELHKDGMSFEDWKDIVEPKPKKLKM